MKLSIPIKALSINKAFRGRHYKTKECKDYENDLWKLLPKKEKILGRVEIHYKFYLKNHQRTDIDNLVKVTQDILVAKGYIEDDRKIYKAVVEKIPSETDSIEVEILTYPPKDT